MVKAIRCKHCHEEEMLRFFNRNGDMWWIGCEKCGNAGPAKQSKAEAGYAWNEANKESAE